MGEYITKNFSKEFLLNTVNVYNDKDSDYILLKKPYRNTYGNECYEVIFQIEDNCYLCYVNEEQWEYREEIICYEIEKIRTSEILKEWRYKVKN